MVSYQFATASSLVNQKAPMMDASKPFTPRVFKKRYFMKYLVLTLFAATLTTLTFAQGSFAVKFSDTGFNYYGGEKDIKTGYVHLGYAGGMLMVSLSDEVSPMVYTKENP